MACVNFEYLQRAHFACQGLCSSLRRDARYFFAERRFLDLV